jgi:DNA-binding NtrC family response regulator
MEKFIAQSEISKQILKSAKLSADLPVNTLIYGEVGVGKKLLALEILPNKTSIMAKELEKLINNKQINLEEYSSLIVHNIHQVINIDEFLENLKNIKLVATSLDNHTKYHNTFAIKLEIPSLEERKEDLDELITLYKKEAMNIYGSNINVDKINIDLSGNGITLKQSIYKSILLHSMSKNEMMQTLQSFIYRELHNGKTYKELLELFEVPLLKAAKEAFKSQLKMAEKLSINRITLRKKIHQYFGEL